MRTLISLVLLGLSCAHLPARSGAEARADVDTTERAFAKAMADRDFTAFQAHLADEAIFFTGKAPLRGKAAVSERWAKYFQGAAPFSWAPDTVEVLDSGTLALSAGPVCDPSGQLIGRFSSIWRREAGGWKIVFDHGEPVDPSVLATGCPLR